MDAAEKKIYIVGNWKMNPMALGDAKNLFTQVEEGVHGLGRGQVEVVACPPALFLSHLEAEGRVQLGAQDLFWENRGAFTGELSAEMLRRAGAKFVIVGHSERRRYLGETDEMVKRKLSAALAGQLRPILCVGESAEERQREETGERITSQLEQALSGLPVGEMARSLLVAYEPLWAINSGDTASPDEVMGVGLLIRKVLIRICADRALAESIPLLYGGSVNAANCFDLVDKTGMSGLLVGGASLRASEFTGIVKAFTS